MTRNTRRVKLAEIRAVWLLVSVRYTFNHFKIKPQ